MKKINEIIPIHNKNDFQSMRKAGKFAAELLDYLTPFVTKGTSTQFLNDLSEEYTQKHEHISGPLNYKGFPKSICTSVNHVVCHGIPSDKKILKEGDIINIDVTPIVHGWYGDTSRMFILEKASIKAKKLVQVTYECLMKALDIIRPGTTTGDIGSIIQEHAHENGFSVVRDFVGHGVGKVFHCEPTIFHYGKKGQGLILEEGMFFTVEPMINAGKHHVSILCDNWTAITKDRSLSAQFEHSIGVTWNGCEIFTASSKGYHCPPYCL